MYTLYELNELIQNAEGSNIFFELTDQARVSEDYHPGGDQWRIGVTSLFVGALGMRPSKDTFWTVKTQPEDPSGVVS